MTYGILSTFQTDEILFVYYMAMSVYSSIKCIIVYVLLSMSYIYYETILYYGKQVQIQIRTY